MPVFLIEAAAGDGTHASVPATTYYVESTTPDAACAALQAVRGVGPGLLEVVEEVSRSDAAAIRCDGTWIGRVGPV